MPESATEDEDAEFSANSSGRELAADLYGSFSSGESLFQSCPIILLMLAVCVPLFSLEHNDRGNPFQYAHY